MHEKVIRDIIDFAEDEGFESLGVTVSPITGPKGNVEFLAYFLFNPLKRVEK